MIRTAFLIFSGNAFASLLLLVRNLIIARLIPVADFGVAATFAIAMSIVEMMSTFGLQQQIVQAKEGDDPKFQAALQGFQVLRGSISSLVMFAISIPLAQFFEIPEATWAYQIMAVVPLLNALGHFDIHRLNRTMVFGPMIVTGILPALVSVLAVWPLSHWFGDWRVMLYAVLIQALVTTITSHIVAQRPYRLEMDRRLMRQSIRFGWPLLVNGILMFMVFNGDRLIVGRTLGMETLAIFAMGVTLTLTPTLVLTKSVQNFFLPLLSRLDYDGTPDAVQRFNLLAIGAIEANLLNGVLLVFVTVLVGEPFVHLLLGAKYGALVPILTLMAVMQALRVFKGGGSVVALARRQTSNAMVANLFRVASLPVAWWMVSTGGTLVGLIWVGIVGELCGFVMSLLMLGGRAEVKLMPLRGQLSLTALFLTVAAANGVLPWGGLSQLNMLLLLAAILAALVVSMKTLRKSFFGRAKI
ncbi:oligosaccharide flippase family protein [Cypionkella sp. TWP1-2-1b2]|uniref:oligosaccharide flippase family protein n=1 Tax=Cypionkella sp. TWP1-2-1b2 TaxID=2804675 RepID=UPI003CE731E4